MAELWTRHKPQEVVPGGTALNPSSKHLGKAWNTNVRKSYDSVYAEYSRAAVADRAALARTAGPPGLPLPPMRATIATPQRLVGKEEGESEVDEHPWCFLPTRRSVNERYGYLRKRGHPFKDDYLWSFA